MGTFYTDVIMKDLRFNSVAKIDTLDLLEPVTRQKVEALIADAKAHGHPMIVFETYRSQQRQEALFRQGVTQLQKVGVHHYGLACDIVKLVNGKASWAGDFSFLGPLAQSHGLIWGGNWGHPEWTHEFHDNDHVQRCSIAHQAALFNGSWYPDEHYDPYHG